jgi:hypothetical protein
MQIDKNIKPRTAEMRQTLLNQSRQDKIDSGKIGELIGAIEAEAGSKPDAKHKGDAAGKMKEVHAKSQAEIAALVAEEPRIVAYYEAFAGVKYIAENYPKHSPEKTK